MLPTLLLAQTASVDTPGLLAIANRKQVLLIRRQKGRYAIISAKQAAREIMPGQWRSLAKPVLACWPYRTGFMVYEEKGDLPYVASGQSPLRKAGPIPRSMPQLPLQRFDTDARGRAYVFVNAGGDESYSGLALLGRGKWLVYKGDPLIYPRGFSARMFGQGSVGETRSAFWFPDALHQAVCVSKQRLGGASSANELTTADPQLRAYALRTESDNKFILVTVRGDRVRIGWFVATYLDPRRCFMPSEDCLVDFEYAAKGDRLAVSRVHALPRQRPFPSKFPPRKRRSK